MDLSLYEIYDIIKALYMRLHGHDNENMKNNIKIQRMTY